MNAIAVDEIESEAVIDGRERRGLAIAQNFKLTRKGKQWLVPSQSGKGGFYTVDANPSDPWCTCPDHETWGHKCKHLFAVEHTIERRRNPNGDTTITETVTVRETVTRQTYRQNWPAYNAAQTNEKDKFQQLLHDLCEGIPQPPSAATGRRALPLGDAVFAVCFKVYSTMSTRRFASDLREAQARGYIGEAPHFNSILNYMDSEALTPVLRDLITETSLPLKTVESDFACDSSGFSTSRFVRWFDHKYGTVR